MWKSLEKFPHTFLDLLFLTVERKPTEAVTKARIVVFRLADVGRNFAQFSTPTFRRLSRHFKLGPQWAHFELSGCRSASKCLIRSNLIEVINSSKQWDENREQTSQPGLSPMKLHAHRPGCLDSTLCFRSTVLRCQFATVDQSGLEKCELKLTVLKINWRCCSHEKLTRFSTSSHDWQTICSRSSLEGATFVIKFRKWTRCESESVPANVDQVPDKST